MRKTALYTLLILTLVSFSEGVLVNISAKNEKISAVMAQIEKQTGAVFSYNPQSVDVERKITIDIKSKTLKDAVYILLSDKFKYNIRGKYIIITSGISALPEIYASAEKQKNENTENNIKESSGKINDTCINSRTNEIALKSIEKKFASVKLENYKKDTIMFKKFASIVALSALTTVAVNATPTPPETKVEKKQKPKKERRQKDRVVLPKKSVQLSFLYPMGTTGTNSPDYDYKLSLNVLGGITGDVSGGEFAGLFNWNKQDVRGIQASGIFNMTEGGVKGLQLASSFNMVSENVKGVQFSGIFNQAQEVNGLQASSLFNYADAADYQLSFMMNMVYDSSKLQMSGLVNYADDAKVQFAGAVNIATDESKVQMSGLVNIADESKVQLAGLLNKTKKGRFQLGIVNIRDTADGISLGFVNITKKGGVLDLGFMASEFIGAGIYFKTGTEKLYSIISINHSFHQPIYSWGFGLGTTLYKRNKLRIGLEASNYSLYDKKVSSEKYNGLSQLAPIIKYNFSNKFYAQISPTFNFLLNRDDDLEITKPYSLWDNNNKSIWIGVNAGIFVRLGK